MNTATNSPENFGAIASMPRLSAAMVLLSCTLVTILYAATITIANVSLPQIQGALSASPDQIAWVVTSNLIATAVTIPAAGWLSARFGRRRTVIAGISGFAVSSTLCGLSTSLEELIFWRVVQSACGSPLTPIAQSLVLDQFSGRRRGPAIAIFGIGVVLGPTLAPLAGGYVSEEWSWRWVFFILVPVALAALLGVIFFIKEAPPTGRRARLDWTGFLSLAVAVSCVQLVLDRGELEGWFTSTEIVLETFLGVVAGWIFIVHSLTARNPFLDPRLLSEWNFCIGMAIILIFGMLMVTPMVLLPAALQQLRDFPDFTVGLVLAVRGLGTLVSQILMLVVSNRWDPRVIMVIGFGAHTSAGWAMGQFDINVTMWDVVWTSALQGFGVGCLWVPITLVVFSNLPLERTAEGAGMFHFIRSIASSYFISACFVVVFHSAKMNYADMTNHISLFNEMLSFPWVRGGYDIESIGGLARVSGEIARQSLMIGYINAFQLFTWASVAVFPLIFLVRWPPRPSR